MPIMLPPMSRRGFLKRSLAGSAGILVCRVSLAGDASTDANRFALMGDTHIAADEKKIMRGAHLAGNLEKACKQIVALEPRPTASAVLGDCALLDGQPGDYVTLSRLLMPVRRAGVPIHLVLGNHDHRQRCWQEIAPDAGQDKVVPDRHITVLEAPLANWFMLDSLDVVNKSPGALGDAQLQWLDAELGKRVDKPALIVTHHNPSLGEKKSSLTDGTALYKVLLAHRHVKAHFFGHTHTWKVQPHQSGIHLVNLPPVAYTFGKGKPSGWIDVTLSAVGAAIRMNSLNPKHSQHGQTVEIQWRS